MNLALFEFISEFSGRFLFLDILGIALAKYLVFLILFLVAWFIFTREDWKLKVFSSLFILFSVLLSRGIIASLLKNFSKTERPFVTLDFEPLVSALSTSAFPSGHASMLFVIAFSLFFFSKKWGWWMLSFAILNGLARIFVGLHWPGDILGGIVVSLISFAITYFLFSPYFDRIKSGESSVATKSSDFPHL